MTNPPLRRMIAGLSLVALLASGCSAVTTSSGATGTSTGATSAGAAPAGTAASTVAEALAANTEVTRTSGEYDPDTAVQITLSGDTASSLSPAVSSSGGTVTISAPGTYLLSGSLNGQIVVSSQAEDAVRLVLAGVSITSSRGAAIAVTEAGEVALVLAEGTVNTLSDTAGSDTAGSDTAGGDTAGSDTDTSGAALLSRADLTITGSGSLQVTGNDEDGIVSKDGLVIESGSITVTAVDDGIRGKDYLRIDGGVLTITSGGDALSSDNDSDAAAGWIAVLGGSVRATSGGDGLAAHTDVIVGDGTLDITSGGGAAQATQAASDTSTKALKAGSSIVLGGGTLSLDAADDTLNSDSIISITGGTLQLASGDDAIHADSNLTITGGTITVTTSVEGLESEVITIAEGDITVTSSDDAVNAAAAQSATTGSGGQPGEQASSSVMFTMTGGRLVLDAGGDGLDSNGSATIEGGTMIINGPSNDGNAAIDVAGTFLVNGGTVVAFGSAGMAMAPSTSSAQAWVAGSASGTAGQVQVLKDGQLIAEYTATRPFASVLLSSAAVTAEGSYQILSDGRTIAELSANSFVGSGPGAGGMGAGGMGAGTPGGGRRR